MEFFKKTNIKFIGREKIYFLFSGCLILITIISIIAHKGFNLSIDFIGGTMIQLKFEKPIVNDLGKLRAIITDLNLGQPEVKTVGAAEDNEVQISVKKQLQEELIGDAVQAAIKKGYPENTFEVRRVESVGPKVGKELAMDTTLAVLLSFLVIAIYVAFRFQLPFGVGAALSLMHDTIVSIGFISICNIEVSLPVIAAILTIIGYSINDTIVIYDRIRENFGKTINKQTLAERINESINQTLSRTIITTGVTLFSVVAMYMFFFRTGDVIEYFSAVMIAGLISGTYSTVCIASPFLVYWDKKWPLKIHGNVARAK
ncbi:MAG: protein translocase subunit SecF [Chitinivibrionales bacterium]|nr:protein translocase subunit SecF [Chitinivibrionales bacterium]